MCPKALQIHFHHIRMNMIMCCLRACSLQLTLLVPPFSTHPGRDCLSLLLVAPWPKHYPGWIWWQGCDAKSPRRNASLTPLCQPDLLSIPYLLLNINGKSVKMLTNIYAGSLSSFWDLLFTVTHYNLEVLMTDFFGGEMSFSFWEIHKDGFNVNWVWVPWLLSKWFTNETSCLWNF